MQPTITIAIQGDRASFHEIAAHNYYQQPIELVYCESFKQVFEELTGGTVDKAFVAVSNSSHGIIDEVSSLIKRTNPVIEGHYLLPIKQHIIGLPNTDLKRVTTIVSHPVALSQCNIHIEEYFDNAETQSFYDTSAAVEYVKQLNDPTIVAIASDAAATLHGLTILHPAIQNDSDNATLFKSLAIHS